MFVRPLIYPLSLLVGALLAVVAGLLHPDLAGDGAAQLSGQLRFARQCD